ncbi:MAG: hypothetical protein GY785_08915 [Gammaproteobacteria bacterium]|nr:hypothetical protein [Gammaproteobacteria bacterium]
MSIAIPAPATRIFVATFLAVLFPFVLVGCGSSSSGSTDDSTSLSGSVFAAPVNGANCELRDKNGTMVVDNVATSATGHYNLDLSNSVLDDDLLMICSGGTYTDEADGSIQNAGEMAAYALRGTLGPNASVHVTPGSTIIHSLTDRHGKSFNEAVTIFDAAFGFTPDITIEPTDATNPQPGASENQLLAGLRAAIFSQLTKDLGLLPGQQFVLLDGLSQDLSDGVLDGRDATGAITISGTILGLPADIQNRFATAVLNFRAGNDATGLTNDKIGTLPFAKTVLTSSYQVDYLPGMMDAMQGKTRFKLRLTDRITEMAVPAANVTFMPMMYMAMHNHSTPIDGACTESATAGTYDCTIYYLMPSQMMSGESMGYWDLKVMANGEMAHLYPTVMMAMGDTARADLKGVNDQVMNMMTMTMESRRYHIFKSSLSGMTGNHDFQVFIAARETMMGFPKLTDGSVLNSGEMYQLSINSIVVEMSTDLVTWATAASVGNGYWSASGLTGLTNGSQGNIYVKLSVSGEQKSTNGQVASGDNAYATFAVTPGGM